jgi:hypothetical protein
LTVLCFSHLVGWYMGGGLDLLMIEHHRSTR